jgi:D-glycero-D-manno-heptose 1,7-bisphosphate phosphatase
VLVSNQSGIARRYYDWQGFHSVQAALAAALAQAGARLDAVFACAHHADGFAPFNVANHPWRKPNPGMILAACERMKLDLPSSWIVGDRGSDLAAGRAAQLAGGILLSRGEDDREIQAAKALKADDFAVELSPSLADAVAVPDSARTAWRARALSKPRGSVVAQSPVMEGGDIPRHSHGNARTEF